MPLEVTWQDAVLRLALAVVAGAVIGFVLLWALRWADLTMSRQFRTGLTVCAQRAGLAEDDLRRAIEAAGHRIVFWAVCYEDGAQRYKATTELEWRGHESDRGAEPEFVKAARRQPRRPQGRLAARTDGRVGAGPPWRMGWDSNPRTVARRRFSRPVP